MGKLCEEGNVCRDFHKSFWEGRCYLGGTCCLPHLYFLLEMKQYALKLCSSVSSQDFAQLALLPSWAESTLLTLGKREDGLWCYRTLGKGERGDDTEGQPSLPCTHKMQHSRDKLSCTPPDQIQLMIRELGTHETILQKLLARLKFEEEGGWRGWSFTSEGMSKCHYKAQKGVWIVWILLFAFSI